MFCFVFLGYLISSSCNTGRMRGGPYSGSNGEQFGYRGTAEPEVYTPPQNSAPIGAPDFDHVYSW